MALIASTTTMTPADTAMSKPWLSGSARTVCQRTAKACPP